MNIPTLDLIIAILGIGLGAAGVVLLLPHQHGRIAPKRAYTVGGSLALASVLLLALLWRPAGSGLLGGAFFYAFAIAAVAGSILMISSRDPIYSALWFASVVLSTSGLFLLAGAQFLAAGTIIVYAGAIIVTFLFVIMLAQKDGKAIYDRTANAPLKTTLCSFLLLWSLTFGLLSARSPQGHVVNTVVDEALVTTPVDAPRPWLVAGKDLVEQHRARQSADISRVLDRSLSPTSRLVEPHVAGLGGALFTDHLVTIELAGALLFIGLIGAVAIAAPRPPVRPGAGAAVPEPSVN